MHSRSHDSTDHQEAVPAQEDWPLLVVVPASLRLAWAEELERWLPLLRPSAIRVIEGKDDRLSADDTHIQVCTA